MLAGNFHLGLYRSSQTSTNEILCFSLFRLLFGLNNRTTAYQVMLAAYEAICFQTRDLIESFSKDTPTWKHIDSLTVSGECSDNSFLLQMLADLCGIRIERPQTTYPACLGTMIAAGLTMKILHMDRLTSMFTPPMEIFKPTMCLSCKGTFTLYELMTSLTFDLL